MEEKITSLKKTATEAEEIVQRSSRTDLDYINYEN